MAKASGRYEQIFDGEWFEWDRKGNLLQCCDCSLVHLIDFRINPETRKIEARFVTDRRRTNRIRKRSGITVKRKKS